MVARQRGEPAESVHRRWRRSVDAQAEALAEILKLDDVVRAWIVKLPPAGFLPAWMGG